MWSHMAQWNLWCHKNGCGQNQPPCVVGLFPNTWWTEPQGQNWCTSFFLYSLAVNSSSRCMNSFGGSRYIHQQLTGWPFLSWSRFTKSRKEEVQFHSDPVIKNPIDLSHTRVHVHTHTNTLFCSVDCSIYRRLTLSNQTGRGLMLYNPHWFLGNPNRPHLHRAACHWKRVSNDRGCSWQKKKKRNRQNVMWSRGAHVCWQEVGFLKLLLLALLFWSAVNPPCCLAGTPESRQWLASVSFF